MRRAAGTTLSSTPRAQQVPLDLRRDEAGEAAGLCNRGRGFDLLRRHVRRREVQHLPGVHEIVQGLERLVDRRLGIGVVLVIEVDPVGAQPAQADLARGFDPPPQRARFVGLVRRAGRELGGDHNVVSPTAERRAEKLLRLPAAVHLGSVEVRDPGIEGGVRRPARDASSSIFIPKLLHPSPTTDTDGPSPPSTRVSIGS